MEEKTVLELLFADAYDTTVKITIEDPRLDLMPPEVETAMTNIVALGIIGNSNGAVVGIKGAQIVTRSVSEINLN